MACESPIFVQLLEVIYPNILRSAMYYMFIIIYGQVAEELGNIA